MTQFTSDLRLLFRSLLPILSLAGVLALPDFCSPLAADQGDNRNYALIPASRPEMLATVHGKFQRFSGKPTDIIFDGDSITNRWEDQGAQTWAAFKDRAANFGIEGDRTENLLWRLGQHQVEGMDPKLVVLLIGTNNVSGGYSVEQIADGIRAILDEYKKQCPHAHFVLMAIFPRGKSADDPMRQKAEAVNALIRPLADGDRVDFLDLTPQMVDADGTLSSIAFGNDYLHPLPSGYAIWANALQPYVTKYAPAHA